MTSKRARGTSSRGTIRALILGIAALSLWLAPLGALAQPEPEAGAFVGIVQFDAAGQGGFSGTGFIISPDGTVVTQSRVVSKVLKDPAHNRLIILYEGLHGREFYGANLVCATPPPVGAPDSTANGPYAKDSALVRITQPTVPYHAWGYPFPDGQRYDYIRHEGPLPKFPTLHVSDHAVTEDQPIRAEGYGLISGLPRLHTVAGTVLAITSAQDGTPLLRIFFVNAKLAGDGWAILNAQGDVVGLMGSAQPIARSVGMGQGLTVVQHPCPQESAPRSGGPGTVGDSNTPTPTR